MAYVRTVNTASGTRCSRQLVLARIIEPVSKLSSIRVLEEADIAPPSYRTIERRLVGADNIRHPQAAGGPAPEGGTAGGASAKGPVRPPGPAAPSTPIRRHSAPQDLPGIVEDQGVPPASGAAASGLRFPGRPQVGPGPDVLRRRRACGCAEEVISIPAINGRPVISRADMAARGVPASTVNGWYRERARTGHPEKAGRIGRTDYWYEDEWTAWYQDHQRRKIESLTRVDRDGDPDDLVDAAEAARMLRYARRNVIHANRRLGYFPEPDAYGVTARGRRAPLWKRSTVWAVADRRRGVGGGHKPGTPGAPAKPHPYAGDERLAQVLAGLRSGRRVSSAQLAAEWNVSQRTAERIIRVARTLTEA